MKIPFASTGDGGEGVQNTLTIRYRNMKFFKFKSWFLWKDSLILSMSVLTVVETIFAVVDLGLENVC